MTYADQVFIETCKRILDSEYSDFGLKVRTKWGDGTPAHTKKTFYVAHSYDLRPDEDGKSKFPLITLRQTYWKSAIREVLWIYQKASNRIEDLKLKIWDQWADESGTIGKGYGYQIAKIGKVAKVDKADSEAEAEFKEKYPSALIKPDEKGDPWLYLNQMDNVLYQLNVNRYSRQIMTNTFYVPELKEMGLAPCAYGMYFNVCHSQVTGKDYLNGILQQRSQDMLTANNWNTAQYAALLMLVAHEVGIKPGFLEHVIYDCHIYDRHIPLVQEMLDTAESNPNFFEEPTIYINPDATFYSASVDDFIVENYKFQPFNEIIEVAT